MIKKVITTVGTSLFTNYMKKEVKDATEFKEKGYKSIDDIYRRLEDAEIGVDTSALKKIIKEYWLDSFRPGASAEINSLLKIAENEKIEAHLIATETALSVAACELIKDYLGSELNQQKEQFNAVHFDKEKYVVEGLQVRDAKKFQDYGFNNLVELIIGLKSGNDNTVLNISGGYKAVIPPLTLMAQLEKMALVYLYEDSNEPIETGFLPINFDWAVIEEFIVLLNNDNKRNNANEEDIEAMRKLKMVRQDSRDLTILGQLTAKYSNNASPFTSTIFGYFIEHKLFECFSKEYGADRVEHSVKYEGMGSEDIDILIVPREHEFISIEIKPSSYLSDGVRMQDIAEKLAKRSTIAIEKGNRGIPVEVWLLVYSYTESKGEVKTLKTDEIELLARMGKYLKENLNPSLAFRLKHYYIVQNKLKSERHIYQTFMKETIKPNQIIELFNS